MKIKFLSLILSILLYLGLNPANSLADTKSASASASILGKLQELKTEISSKAAILETQISQKLQNRTYVGTIKSLKNNSWSLNSLSGQQQVRVNQDTTFLANGKQATQSAFTTGDFVAALGDVDDNEVLTATQVVKLNPSDQLERQVISGQISQVNTNSVQIVPENKKTLTITIDDLTTYQIPAGEVKVDNLAVNNKVMAVIEKSKDGNWLARLIFILPPKQPTTPTQASASSPLSNR